MELGMVGLGRMGANMVQRLIKGGHSALVFDINPEAVAEAASGGAKPATSLANLVQQLAPPRVVWCMLPAGTITEQTLSTLSGLLSPGDIVIDGGNTYFKDDLRRAGELGALGIHYVDVGTSGGIWGLERGYCLTVGGPTAAFEHLRPVLETLAPPHEAATRTPGRKDAIASAERGFIHCGPAGSGHFVKMVHNGIEYGIMQAYAEGMELLRSAAEPGAGAGYRYDLNLADITEVWRRGSVIGSWLLDLCAIALQQDPKLDRYSGYVQDSGEGRWTVNTAVENAVPTHVLSSALFARFRSREECSFADRMLSAMREKFGGHQES